MEQHNKDKEMKEEQYIENMVISQQEIDALDIPEGYKRIIEIGSRIIPPPNEGRGYALFRAITAGIEYTTRTRIQQGAVERAAGRHYVMPHIKNPQQRKRILDTSLATQWDREDIKVIERMELNGEQSYLLVYLVHLANNDKNAQRLNIDTYGNVVIKTTLEEITEQIHRGGGRDTKTRRRTLDALRGMRKIEAVVNIGSNTKYAGILTEINRIYDKGRGNGLYITINRGIYYKYANLEKPPFSQLSFPFMRNLNRAEVYDEAARLEYNNARGLSFHKYEQVDNLTPRQCRIVWKFYIKIKFSPVGFNKTLAEYARMTGERGAGSGNKYLITDTKIALLHLRNVGEIDIKITKRQWKIAKGERMKRFEIKQAEAAKMRRKGANRSK